MAVVGHADIRTLEAALDAVDDDARRVIYGLTAEQGIWRPAPASWSIAHCLDHLATANRVYLRAMEPAAVDALARGSRRRRPALPGLIGSWFVRSLDAPVKPRFRMKAPAKIVPRESPALVHFPNPFIPGVRFSLATGLHVIAAHDRRHLSQAWNVRNALST